MSEFSVPSIESERRGSRDVERRCNEMNEVRDQRSKRTDQIIVRGTVVDASPRGTVRIDALVEFGEHPGETREGRVSR